MSLIRYWLCRIARAIYPFDWDGNPQPPCVDPRNAEGQTR